MARAYQCLEAGCDEQIIAADEDALVEAVQRHIGEKHDSFELEEAIRDMSIEVEDSELEGR
jgi:hypothetical protein